MAEVPSLAWVVGSTGLVGASTRRALERRGPVWVADEPVPWGTGAAGSALARSARRFAVEAAGVQRWSLAWCAGAGVTGASRSALGAETAALSTALDALGAVLPTGVARRGAVFLTSSVGGAYAGSSGPPFTEATPEVPLSAYGAAKLDQERVARAWAERTGVRLVLGRLTNVFGPDQDLRKPQGLVSQVVRAALLRQPIGIYVPLDTVRDYLFAPDAGELVADCLERAHRGPVATTLKIVGSSQGVTVGAVVAELARLLKRRPPVTYGASPASRVQAGDLRVRSATWPELDERALTPFPVGLAAVVAGVGAAQRAGALAPVP